MIKPYTLAALLGYSFAAKEDHWAVIVAGSNGYWNYRHQADACHAYQIAKAHGVPEDQIIMMAYDDIAHNSQNPFRGKIFNKPNGHDVYEGCKIDYKGADVTPENFLAVLQGDDATTMGGKVLKSNKDSKVFVNFVDHGGPGLIGFPSEYLYANKLHETIMYMHEHNLYGKLTFYMEACESGSMFPNLPDNINFYAATAANAHESSWGIYCYPNDVVQGKHLNSCLGDTFSITWMEDSDLNHKTESLDDQFHQILKRTNRSHPQKFGDFSFSKDPIFEFQGDVDVRSEWYAEPNTASHVQIDSRDAKLHYLYARNLEEPTHHNSLELQKELNHRMEMDILFAEFAAISMIDTEARLDVENYECLESMMTRFQDLNGEKLSDYALKYAHRFVSACQTLPHPDLALHALEKAFKQ